MRALTVRQPWAWAIVHGGKDVENRTRNVAGSYRGPVLIHSSLTEDAAAYDDDMIRQALDEVDDGWILAEQMETGAALGVVELVDVHAAAAVDEDPWSWCCRPWGQPPGITMRRNLTFTGPTQHLVLANPRPLPRPISAKGRLGLWTPDQELVDAVLEQLVEPSA